MSIDHEPSTVAWLPTVGPAMPQFVQRGGLLLPADLDVEPTAAAAAAPGAAETEAVEAPEPVEAPEAVEEVGPGTDLQPREQGTDLEPADVEPELVDADDEPLGDEPGSRWAWLRPRRTEVDESADGLARRLAADRAVIEIGRDDELRRRLSDAEHQMALDGVAEQVTAVRRERAERARDAVEAEKLAALYRHTASAGERARIASEISRTGEMRALRIAKLQKAVLGAGLPALVGFGLWSTAGVHGGLVKLMNLTEWSAGWIAAWPVEPLLITVVAGLIVFKAVLKMSGGAVDDRIVAAEVGVLGLSLGLNLFGGWPEHDVAVVTAIGTAMAHSVGAIMAAVPAWLIGVLIDLLAKADPWKGAPRIADLGLLPSGNPSGSSSATASARASGRASETAIRRGKRTPLPVDRTALPEEMQKLLDAVRDAITQGRLDPDPTAYSIYRHVMNNRGDRARSKTLAELVDGWRPPLRAVDDVDSAAG